MADEIEEGITDKAALMYQQLETYHQLQEGTLTTDKIKTMGPDQLQSMGLTPAFMEKYGHLAGDAFIRALGVQIRLKSKSIRASIEEALSSSGSEEAIQKILEQFNSTGAQGQLGYLEILKTKYAELVGEEEALANAAQTTAQEGEAATNAEVAAKQKEIDVIHQIIEALLKKADLDKTVNQQAQALLDNMEGRTLPGRGASDASVTGQKVARALSSISMLSSAMDGLINNFKEFEKTGKLSVTSLISSFGSLFMSATNLQRLAGEAGFLPK